MGRKSLWIMAGVLAGMSMQLTAFAQAGINYDAIYGPILDDVYANFGEWQPYSLYDIDQDGVKELFINRGTSIMMGLQELYTIQNGVAVELGGDADIRADTSFYVPYDGNGILSVWSRQGDMSVSRVNKIGLELFETGLYSNDGAWGETLSVPGTALPYAYAEDHSILRDANGGTVEGTYYLNGQYILTMPDSYTDSYYDSIIIYQEDGVYCFRHVTERHPGTARIDHIETNTPIYYAHEYKGMEGETGTFVYDGNNTIYLTTGGVTYRYVK